MACKLNEPRDAKFSSSETETESGTVELFDFIVTVGGVMYI